MKQILPHIPRSSDPSPEAQLPVSPGLTDLGDRVSFMGVEVAKGKGGPLTPDIKRVEGDATTARSVQQPIELEGDGVLGSHDGKESGRCQ